VANTAPAITLQPQSQTVVTGSSVTFTSAASGTPTPTFQWRKNTVNINGATNSSYTIASAAAGDAGSYTVVATNSVSSATSNAAILTVSPAAVAPAITLQPIGQTVTAGSPVTLTAAASGTPAPTFQWRKDTVNINGATGSSYTIAQTTAGDAGVYTFVATNSAGSATSNGVTLTVKATRSAAVDFNGDGKADLLWQNSMTGERALWLMNGTNLLNVSTLGIFPLEWTVAATGDFNNDGKPDIIWSNSITGERAIWLMNGTNFLAASTLGVFPLEWTVAGIGDYNGDGKPDIIWSNSLTGERALWLMNGTNFLASSTLGIFPLEWTVMN
jgi:Immunoglobulin domain/FG-GAP-like repeat